MTVVVDIRLKLVTTILASEYSLEFDALWLFSTQRLQLGKRVLPVELARVLLPFKVSLLFFLSLVGVSKTPDLIKCFLAFLLRLFGQLDKFLYFVPNLFVLFLNRAFDTGKFILDLALDIFDSLVHSSCLYSLRRSHIMLRWLNRRWNLQLSLLPISLVDKVPVRWSNLIVCCCIKCLLALRG